MDDLGAWNELETQLREAFEHNLEKMKKALLSPPTAKPAKKNKPPIIPITALYFDSSAMMPLGIYEFDVWGSPEGISRLLESKHAQLVKSFAYRKGQSVIFNRLKDEFKLSDKTILNMLIPEAEKEERELVYKRLKQNRRRKTHQRRATK